jgi:hypothetical protein
MRRRRSTQNPQPQMLYGFFAWNMRTTDELFYEFREFCV